LNAVIVSRWHDSFLGRGHIWRDYFKLMTVSGVLVIISRDLRVGVWRLQRLYD